MSALTVSLAGRDVLRSSDLAAAETEAVLDLAAELKLDRYEPRLPGRTLGLLFKKPSTRTRVPSGMWSVASRVEPNAKDSAALDRQYHLYRKLYPALREISHELGGVPA